MGKLTERYDDYDLIFDMDHLTITIIERWKYNWNIHENARKTCNDWTYLERKDFHDDLDKYIWKNWSYKYESICKITNEGTIPKDSRLWKKINNKKFSIIFDIQWVLTNQHWTANIYKTKHQSDIRSNVDRNDMSVNLTWKDNSLSYFSPENTSQNTFSHEFGHTIGAGDEYSEKRVGSTLEEINNYNFYYESSGTCGDRYRYELDYSSLMNVGNSLRKRFVNKIDKRLDKLFTDVSFNTYLK